MGDGSVYRDGVHVGRDAELRESASDGVEPQKKSAMNRRPSTALHAARRSGLAGWIADGVDKPLQPTMGRWVLGDHRCRVSISSTASTCLSAARGVRLRPPTYRVRAR